jgi:hypothetical protein
MTSVTTHALTVNVGFFMFLEVWCPSGAATALLRCAVAGHPRVTVLGTRGPHCDVLIAHTCETWQAANFATK